MCNFGDGSQVLSVPEELKNRPRSSLTKMPPVQGGISIAEFELLVLFVFAALISYAAACFASGLTGCLALAASALLAAKITSLKSRNVLSFHFVTSEVSYSPPLSGGLCCLTRRL